MPGPGGIQVLPGTTGNHLKSQTYGFEVASNYDVSDIWRLYTAYSFLVMTDQGHGEMGSPRNQFYVQSSWDLCRDLQLDVTWRYVDAFPGPALSAVALPGVPTYNVMDVRLAWEARPGLELSVVGRNLLDQAHTEAPIDPFMGSIANQVEAEVYGAVTWRY